MKSCAVSEDFPDRLLQRLRRNSRTVGPVVGEDGVCRLREVARWAEIDAGALPLIPLKKYVLPPKAELWTLSGEVYQEPSPPAPVALLGIPPCDLYGLDYLDQAFAEDRLYRQFRERLLLVGIECSPGPECFCPPREAPPPFDLFLAGDRAWCGTAAGESLLEDLTPSAALEEVALPAAATRGEGVRPPENLERTFLAAVRDPLWGEVGERCVSCGACSAVCPTCYCYDVVDHVVPGGEVTRTREWDNCFFHSHALVAGGQNFRPSRSERLRFRFEHKLLGFGALRGLSSCVGCGRCGRACPVDIDISAVLERLTVGEDI